MFAHVLDRRFGFSSPLRFFAASFFSQSFPASSLSLIFWFSLFFSRRICRSFREKLFVPAPPSSCFDCSLPSAGRKGDSSLGTMLLAFFYFILLFLDRGSLSLFLSFLERSSPPSDSYSEFTEVSSCLIGNSSFFYLLFISYGTSIFQVCFLFSPFFVDDFFFFSHMVLFPPLTGLVQNSVSLGGFSSGTFLLHPPGDWGFLCFVFRIVCVLFFSDLSNQFPGVTPLSTQPPCPRLTFFLKRLF